MRRSRLAAARAGHVRKRGQPCGRQRNVGSPRGPHLMVSTSMVYGCTIDVFNTEDISARSASDGVDVNGIRVHHRRLQYRRYQCGMSAKVSPQILLRLRPRIVGLHEGRGCGGLLSPSLFRGAAAKPRATLGMDGGLGRCRFFGALLYSFCWMKSPLFLQGCILDLYVHRISYSASKILRCLFCV